MKTQPSGALKLWLHPPSRMTGFAHVQPTTKQLKKKKSAVPRSTTDTKIGGKKMSASDAMEKEHHNGMKR